MTRRTFFWLISAAVVLVKAPALIGSSWPAPADVAPPNPRDLEHLDVQDTTSLQAAWEKQERQKRERLEHLAHVEACADCGYHPGSTPWRDPLPIMSSRALLTAPPGTCVAIGRGGRQVERVQPFYYDICTDQIRKDVRVRLLARIRCRRRELPKGIEAVQRPDGNWILRDWVDVER